jgi:molybdate transport system substrate-binding protein
MGSRGRQAGRKLLLAALAAILPALPSRAADAARPAPLTVAAAANLVYALDALDEEFGKEAPDVAVTAVIGASGNLVVQMEHGAPYDVFLSADLDFPRRLIRDGQAEPGSLTTFAVGRLVLWTARAGIDLTDVASAVRNPEVRKLAIANPATAPYGRAAREALVSLGEWTEIQPRLVVGENISQTLQFVETGNADAGFVALSLVVSPKLKGRGRWVGVPPNLYSPLEQGAVITGHGAANPAALRYLAFLRGPAAHGILEAFGYAVPAVR